MCSLRCRAFALTDFCFPPLLLLFFFFSLSLFLFLWPWLSVSLSLCLSLSPSLPTSSSPCPFPFCPVTIPHLLGLLHSSLWLVWVSLPGPRVPHRQEGSGSQSYLLQYSLAKWSHIVRSRIRVPLGWEIASQPKCLPGKPKDPDSILSTTCYVSHQNQAQWYIPIIPALGKKVLVLVFSPILICTSQKD